MKPYAIKVLTQRLEKERKDLIIFEQELRVVDDKSSIAWADTNKKTCEYRIKELEESIEILKTT